MHVPERRPVTRKEGVELALNKEEDRLQTDTWSATGRCSPGSDSDELESESHGLPIGTPKLGERSSFTTELNSSLELQPAEVGFYVTAVQRWSKGTGNKHNSALSGPSLLRRVEAAWPCHWVRSKWLAERQSSEAFCPSLKWHQPINRRVTVYHLASAKKRRSGLANSKHDEAQS